MIPITLFAPIAPIALAATPVPSMVADEAALGRLVEAFVAAEAAFDQPALARLTAPDYVEISPLGEVDPREKMLGFYAPDKKQPAPAATLAERGVRVHDDTGIVTVRLSYGPAALRVVYVARRMPAGWALVSAQFTPIRPSRPS